MSKRSYRRLAVVAGAALAVGSMTPALAAQVGVNGTGGATVDVSDVALPSADVESLIPGAFIADVQDFALGTVFGAPDLVLDSADGLQTDVETIVGSLLGATSNLSVGLNANANASSGGATVQVSGVATGTSGLVDALPDPGTALTGLQDNLAPVVDFGLGTAFGAVGLAGDAQDLVVGTAGGLLGTGLGLIDGVSVSGNASIIAALMGSL